MKKFFIALSLVAVISAPATFANDSKEKAAGKDKTCEKSKAACDKSKAACDKSKVAGKESNCKKACSKTASKQAAIKADASKK